MLIITHPPNSGHEEAFVLENLVSIYPCENKVIARISCKEYETLGAYETEERAKEIYRDILKEYERHLFSKGGPMLTYEAYAPAFAFLPPKIFIMPDK